MVRPDGKTDASALSEEMLVGALRRCHDPEIPASIVDLGLVYSVVAREGYVRVTMTLTSPDCPMADQVDADVRAAVLSRPGVEAVDVEIVDQPARTPDRMPSAGRAATGR